MRRLLLSVLFGMALLLHFSTGVWSGDPPPKNDPAKGEGRAAVEEKKEEAKKPAEPDKNGTASKDKSWTTDAINKLDEKSDTKAVVSAINEIVDNVSINRSGINMMWTLLTGFLVMFMQAGFAMVEGGLCRAKNAAHTMAMNFMIYAIGMLGFYFIGFAIMYGGINTSFFGNEAELLTSEYKLNLFGKELGLFGYDGFMLAGKAFDVGLLTMFLFQMVFMDTTCTIPTGTMAERWKFIAFVVYGFGISTIIYPVFGNWTWGGGWLAQLGSAFGLGHGHVDFAGSSVVHMTGGVCALAGGLLIGPRIGKYNKDGTVNVLPAHSVPMYMVGTFILAFGWFGFNAGSALKGTDLNIARVAVNTMLASAAGAFVNMVYMWCVYKKPDPSFMCNGMLAGLVAITAPCAFVTPLASIVIGSVAGVLVVWSALFWERVVKVDDPVGAISVHGVNGAWGILSVGLFADGTYGQGWNGSFWYKTAEGLRWLAEKPAEIPAGWEEVGVTGLFYGNTSQLTASLLGIAANVLWVFPVSLAMFYAIDLVVGNRVPADEEVAGLDIPEMGVLGYINDDPATPEGHVLHPGAEPRPARVPPDGKKRYTVVVDGLAPDKISSIWSELCRPGAKAPAPEFLDVYPNMTTLQGNRFRFAGGDPDAVSKKLGKLLQSQASGGTVRTLVET